MTDENNSITRLEEALGRLGAEHEPPAGWEDRVLGVLDKTDIDRPEPATTRPSDMVSWDSTGEPTAAVAHDRRSADAGEFVTIASTARAVGSVDAGESVVVAESLRAADPVDAAGPARAAEPVAAVACDLPRRSRSRRPRWLPIAAVDALGMAAAGACIILGLASPDLLPSGPPKLELAVEVESVGPALRSGSGSAPGGDVMHATVGDLVHATVGGAAHRALWVYHQEQLILRCPGAPECRDTGGATTVDVVLRARGVYAILAVSSHAVLDAPRGTYDADAATARSTPGWSHKIKSIEAR